MPLPLFFSLMSDQPAEFQSSAAPTDSQAETDGDAGAGSTAPDAGTPAVPAVDAAMASSAPSSSLAGGDALNLEALSKVERAKAEACGLDLADQLDTLAAAGWEALDEATLTIRLKWLGIFFRPVTPGRFMVRLRLPNGVITAEQLAFLGDVVDQIGRAHV